MTVFVAKRDIPAGTPGAELDQVRLDRRPRTPSSARSCPARSPSPDQIRTLITRQPIYAGEQVSLRRFADHAEHGVRSQLHGALARISLPGTPDAAARPARSSDGDHVDVLANLKTGDCSTCFAARDVVARDVLVLRAAGGDRRAERQGAGGAGASVMLAVSDRREAQKIFYAVKNAAGWSLPLRPVANATDSRGRRRRHRLDCSRTASSRRTSSTTTGAEMTDRATDDTAATRLYFTGDCDGLRRAPRGVARPAPDLEVVGFSEHVAQASRRARRRPPRLRPARDALPSGSRRPRSRRSASRPARRS